MSTARRRPQGGSAGDDQSVLITEYQPKEPLAEKDEGTPDIRGDRRNIAILLFLYILQGIPIGLIAAIPMLLQNRGASYKQQAEFSFAYWPFSLKLLWAPIVDSLYVRRFGRRKSWLVPVQYLLGGFMMFLSYYVDRWLGGDGVEPNVALLALLFFLLNFLAATQDIAVDGWALTMLKRCNVGYASTCNSVGQTAGYFLGYVLFIALESKDFCNKYLRDVPLTEGMITLPRFLWFWGIVFVVATTLVAIFKKENDIEDAHTDARYTEEHEMNIRQSYKILLDMVKMRPVQILAAILLTVKVTFSAVDAVTSLKLIDAGVPKDQLALLAIPLIPLQLVLPLVMGRYTNGPRPMDVYLKAIPYRILLAAVATMFAYATPFMVRQGHVPVYYYALLIVLFACYQVFLYSMFVAAMAFFAKISDPAVGGTYMTFLNTLCNLGGNWPNTVVLWLVDVLTYKQCSSIADNACLNKEEQQSCESSQGKCDITFDGYYLESFFCVVYGIIWLLVVHKWIVYLQDLPVRSWLVVKHKSR
ncbi:acetyl-coenzyme A transporter 1 [Drosophila subobscura]|uniref:acetyl-coenzyme A transporter 1 n=1 Tax=Drosophila subobscura TaxID=7241 RepID=UPI00155B0021|nr:acetyl-coenzyme A transporter 1 [Drosophila subobscura]XP_034656431.1 acetyl-coenzyme A transporter 1 [Drosophila subobscura]